MILHSHPTIDKEDLAAVKAVLHSGQISRGQKVRDFEKKLAGFIGVKGGLAVSSGTAAIHLSLLALGIGKGDEVILPSFVCCSPYQAVLHAGAKPCLVDIESDNYNLSFKTAKKRVNRRTKAIILPHMFGYPADIQPFLPLGIPIIEDCAQSLGAVLSGKKTGSFGRISIFSFYATKLITTGEGGMVLSDSASLLNKIEDRHNCNQKDINALRFNYKMTDFQAALGISQLNKLGCFIARRKKIAERFTRAFKEKSLLKVPFKEGRHIYYRYILRTPGENTGKFIKALNKKGISAQRPILKPLHQYLGLENFPETDKAYRETISIPIYPSLKEEEVKKIIKAVREVFR